MLGRRRRRSRRSCGGILTLAWPRYTVVQWVQHYTVQYSGSSTIQCSTVDYSCARGILVVQCSAVQCRGRGILFEQQSS